LQEFAESIVAILAGQCQQKSKRLSLKLLVIGNANHEDCPVDNQWVPVERNKPPLCSKIISQPPDQYGHLSIEVCVA